MLIDYETFYAEELLKISLLIINSNIYLQKTVANDLKNFGEFSKY